MATSFVQGILGLFREGGAGKHRDRVLAGRPGPEGDLPNVNVQLSKLHANLLASQSGPDGGVSALKGLLPGFDVDWTKHTPYAYGNSISCYDTSPATGRRNGDPIADCFGILAYPTGAVLALADGANWGEPARRAARCAVLGGVQSLHQSIVELNGKSVDTNTLFQRLLSSVDSAQKLIMQQAGTLTTLVVALLAKVKGSKQWAVLTVTVGDSAAYLVRRRCLEVVELTAGAHDDVARDPRWLPGALGFAQGDDPDLANMTCSIAFAQTGDIVFLASDGVSDNFDPVVLKLAKHMAPTNSQTNSQSQSQLQSQAQTTGGPERDPDLPSLSPSECQQRSLAMLSSVVRHHYEVQQEGNVTAASLCDHILQHVYKVTEVQRRSTEAFLREQQQAHDSRAVDFSAQAVRLPGKMDHATVVAYMVGQTKKGDV